MIMENLFIARQPIYNRNKEVMGYELLYRNSLNNHANVTDGAQASCETILNSFMHIGIDNIAGSALAFINLPREFIIDESLTPMFNEQAVLEVLEDIEPDEEVINGLIHLKSNGYKIALDDFIYREELEPFVKLTDYIKFDIKAQTPEESEKQFNQLKSSKCQFIAEKIETHEEYQYYYDLGFDYFQGFFFCYPEIIKKKSLPSNKLVILNLLQKLQQPDIESNELEQILIQDITLSYKLLRYINSATFSLRREVDSIKDAIVLLGINNLKNWISLIMMSKLVESKPTEIIVTGMVRGKMCELLAEEYHPEIKHQMFVIGLFSVLDALMDQPLIDLLDTVILSTEIKLALLDYSGHQGDIYRHVLEYEKGEWDKLFQSKFSAKVLIDSYLRAVNWADESILALK